MHYYVSLVMSAFSHDLLQMQLDYLRYSKCFNTVIYYLWVLRYLHGTLFLDGTVPLDLNFTYARMQKATTRNIHGNAPE